MRNQKFTARMLPVWIVLAVLAASLALVPFVAGGVADAQPAPGGEPGHSIASNDSGDGALLALKANGDLHIRRVTPGGAFGSWIRLGRGGWASAEIDVDVDGRVELIAVKADGRLYTRSWLSGGEWGPWTSHGVATWDTATQPSISTTGSTITLAAIKENGLLYTRQRSVGGAWGAFVPHGRATWTHVDTASSANGDVWYAGTKDDGRLFTRQQVNGVWGGYESHGAPTWSTTSPPSIAASVAGAVFGAVKADGRLYTRGYSGGGWSGWSRHGATSWSSAAVAIDDDGVIALVAVKTNGLLYTRASNGLWGSWTRQGARNWSPTAPALSLDGGSIHFLAVKASGLLYSREANDPFVLHGAGSWASSNPAPVSPTPVPPTATAVPSTPVPPTATAVPSTPVPPTATPVPSTPVPPTATAVPPTATVVPPTATVVPPTPVPPTATVVPPTATPVPPTPVPPTTTACGIAPPGYNVIESNAATIIGTGGPDFICAGGGANNIRGHGNGDIIYGGGGNDVIAGDYGPDQIFGGPGDDEIDGGPGDDEIDGGAGSDVCVGGSQTDCENPADALTLIAYESPGTAPGVIESARYTVTLSQGAVEVDSYVNASINNHTVPSGAGQPERLATAAEREAKFRTDSNHWTSFEFEGRVTVTVDLPPEATGQNISVRPLSKNIVASVSGDQASFEITEPGQYYLAAEGIERHPLFIFANEIAEPAPDLADPDVFTGAEILANPTLLTSSGHQTVYFGLGVHVISTPTSPFPTIPSNTTIYLERGAYVKGLLEVQENVQNVHIRGRGVLSGFDYPHENTGFNNHMVLFAGFSGSSDISIEGITMVDGPKTCILARSGPIEISNVKCLGWHSNTDGVASGAGSEVRDSFFKIFDDVIKLFHSDITVDSLVIWHQQAGAAIQLSWNLRGPVNNGRVSNIDIVAVDRSVGSLDQTGGTGRINNALINARNYRGGSSNDMVIENVRFDARPFQLVQLQLKDIRDGFSTGVGDISNITVRNVTMAEAPRVDNYIVDNGQGEITNIMISNLTVNGTPIDPASIRVDEITNPN